MIDSKGDVSAEGMFNRAHLPYEARCAYDALLACVLNGQRRCEVPACLGTDAAASLLGLMRDDCPELIHLMGEMTLLKKGGVIVLRPSYARGYEQSLGLLYTKLAKMERSAERILAAAPSRGSAFDRVLAIHDAYLTRYRYVRDRAYSHTADGALLKHRAVCDGWAKGFKYLLDRAGIGCVYAHGRRRDGGSAAHGWCVVNISDDSETPAWYVIDPNNDGRDGKPPLHSFFGLAESELDYIATRSLGRWVPRAKGNLGFYRLVGRYATTADKAISIVRGAGFPSRGVEMQLPVFSSERDFKTATDAVLDRLASTFGCDVSCCMDVPHSVVRIEAPSSR